MWPQTSHLFPITVKSLGLVFLVPERPLVTVQTHGGILDVKAVEAGLPENTLICLFSYKVIWLYKCFWTKVISHLLWKSLVLGTIVGTEHQQIVFFSSKSELKMTKIRENNGAGEKEGDWGRGDIKKCRRIEQRRSRWREWGKGRRRSNSRQGGKKMLEVDKR